jgi:hypothetical protein
MIVTLDLGQSTGWAAGGGPLPPRFGTLRVGPLAGDDSIGPALVAFRRGIAPILIEAKPTEVFIEAALSIKAINNADRRNNRWTKEIHAVFQFQLAGVARMICADLGLPCVNAKVNTVRALFFRGTPEHDQAGKPISSEDRAIMACVKRGWRVSNDHEADAAAILAWRLAQGTGGL